MQQTCGDTPRWVKGGGRGQRDAHGAHDGDNPLVIYVALAQSTAPEGLVLVVKGDRGGGPSARHPRRRARRRQPRRVVAALLPAARQPPDPVRALRAD